MLIQETEPKIKEQRDLKRKKDLKEQAYTIAFAVRLVRLCLQAGKERKARVAEDTATQCHRELRNLVLIRRTLPALLNEKTIKVGIP